jgi:hypothetical protein
VRRVGGGQKGGASASAVLTAAAKQLNVTRVKLKTAIVDSANAYIDSEVESDDLDVDEAAQLKTRVEDDLAFAIATSRTKTVASNLGITVAALNDAFSAARKLLLTAKIDKAQKNGDITAEEAADLKDELGDADLPGYKAGGYGGFDLGSSTRGAGGAEKHRSSFRS